MFNIFEAIVHVVVVVFFSTRIVVPLYAVLNVYSFAKYPCYKTNPHFPDVFPIAIALPLVWGGS